MPGADLIC